MEAMNDPALRELCASASARGAAWERTYRAWPNLLGLLGLFFLGVGVLDLVVRFVTSGFP